MTVLIERLIQKYASKYDLDPVIVYGVCMTESSMNPKATRFEKNYRWVFHVEREAAKIGIPPELERKQQMTSFGLMQTMGGVLREYRYPGLLVGILHDIDAQLEYGCRHLATKIKKYGLHLGILSYNSGSPGRDINGVFFPPALQFNHEYLEKVLKYSEGWINGT